MTPSSVPARSRYITTKIFNCHVVPKVANYQATRVGRLVARETRKILRILLSLWKCLGCNYVGIIYDNSIWYIMALLWCICGSMNFVDLVIFMTTTLLFIYIIYVINSRLGLWTCCQDSHWLALVYTKVFFLGMASLWNNVLVVYCIIFLFLNCLIN